MGGLRWGGKVSQGQDDDDADDDINGFEIKEDLSDLLPKIKQIKSQIKEDPTKLQKMTYNTRARALELLEPISILCYHAEFFRRYAELQNSPNGQKIKKPTSQSFEKVNVFDKKFEYSCRKCDRSSVGLENLVEDGEEEELTPEIIAELLKDEL